MCLSTICVLVMILKNLVYIYSRISNMPPHFFLSYSNCSLAIWVLSSNKIIDGLFRLPLYTVVACINRRYVNLIGKGMKNTFSHKSIVLATKQHRNQIASCFFKFKFALIFALKTGNEKKICANICYVWRIHFPTNQEYWPCVGTIASTLAQYSAIYGNTLGQFSWFVGLAYLCYIFVYISVSTH